MINKKRKYPFPLQSLPGSQLPEMGIFRLSPEVSTVIIFFAMLILYEVSYYISLHNFYLPELSKKIAILEYNKWQTNILLDNLKQISCLGYIIIPFITGLRLVFLCFFIQLPFLLNAVIISHKRIFTVVVRAGFVLSLGESIRVLKIYFTGSTSGQTTAMQFVPFGLLDIINTEGSKPAFMVMLNYFNLFELGWFVLIFGGLTRTLKIKRSDAFFVVSSIWLLIVLAEWSLAHYLSEIGGIL